MGVVADKPYHTTCIRKKAVPFMVHSAAGITGADW